MINKKIKNLTKIFFMDYIEKINILKNNKIDKKSSIFWVLVVLIFCITYISVYIIGNMSNANNPEIVLKIFLPIVAFIMCFQIIIILCNILYYSKDIEYILPLPIKSTEILCSKIFTVIGIMYLTEIIFLLIPLLTYWWFIIGTIRFLVYMIFVLAIFPIVYTLIIGIITIILMQLFKNIKNENIIQSLIIIILTTCLFAITYYVFKDNISLIHQTTSIEIVDEKLSKLNNYFLITNPIIKLLTEKSWINNIINIAKIIFIEGVLFGILYLLDKKTYHQNLLTNCKKNNNNINKKYKYNKNNSKKSYLINEIRTLFRNNTYFTQLIYNFISILIIALIIINTITPMLVQEINVEEFEINSLKIQIFCTVLITIQIIATFNNLAIVAISKEGKNAVFMKYIPLSLNKQFKLKIIPAIILNAIMIISVLIVISTKVPKISICYYFITFITAFILNIIYNILLLLIDCKKPNLNWTNKEAIAKGGNNKIYKYFITIIFILIILYYSSIFENINFIISIIAINIILIILLLLLNRYIDKNIQKIFNKIF